MVFVRDACGIICLIFTYLALFYADYVVTRWIIMTVFINSLWGTFNVFLFNTIIFLLVMAHLKAVFLDPGTVPLPSTRLDFSDIHSNTEKDLEKDQWTVCTRCETFRPPRAHHCRICKRCIKKLDHHCPWINNCVGERNQKYFLQFLVYVGILAVYSIILIILTWMSETDNISNEEAQTRMLHSIILLLESGLFGLFVIAIMVDQLHAILYDETPIEQLQLRGSYRPNRPKMYLMGEVCGHRTSILCWLFPCSVSNRKFDYDSTSFLNHDV